MQNGRKHLGMKNECLGNSNQGKHLAVGETFKATFFFARFLLLYC